MDVAGSLVIGLVLLVMSAVLLLLSWSFGVPPAQGGDRKVTRSSAVKRSG